MATITGTNGNDVLNGDGEDDLLLGLAGNDTLTGNGGLNTISGGAGNDSLIGTSVGDVYVFDGGLDTLAGFEFSGGSGDVLDISAMVDVADLEDLIAISREAGGHVVIEFENSSDRLTIRDTTIADLSADDIIFQTVTDQTLTGDGGDNTLIGGFGNDTVDGAGGNDSLEGRAADDSLTGGAGNDTLSGGDGADRLFGGAGDDLIDGGNGPDLVSREDATGGIVANLGAVTTVSGGGLGTDTVANVDLFIGSDFDDTMSAAAGFDNGLDFLFGDGRLFNRLDGGAGNDVFSGNGVTRLRYADATTGILADMAAGTVTGDASTGSDTFDSGVFEIRGSAFGDSLSGSDADPAITGFESFIGGDGADTIDGRGGRDRVHYATGPNGVDVDLVAGTGVDAFGNTDLLSNIEDIRGTGLSDTLAGDAGGNVFEPDAGADVIDGRGGADTVQYDSRAGGVTVDLSLGRATDNAGDEDTLTSIENAAGSNFADTLIGDVGGNALRGLFGDDVLNGGDGADSLLGDQGNDTLNGGDGDNTLEGGAGDDSLIGGAGENLFVYTAGQDTLAGFQFGSGDVIDISARIEVSDLAGLLAISRDSGSLIFVEFDDGVNELVIRNTNGADLSAGDFIFAPAQNLLLVGDDGPNTLLGGSGDDTLSGLAGADALSGSSGNDSLDGGGDNDILNGEAGDDTLLGGGGNDNLDGGDGTDSLQGDAGQDDLDGGAGNDLLSGGDGADSLLGGDGGDTISGGTGNDTMRGNAGADLYFGGAGDDTILGENGEDTLSFADAAGGVDVVFGDLLVVVTGADAGSNSVRGVDTFFGSDFNDSFTVLESFDSTVDGNFASESGLIFLDGGGGDDDFTGNGQTRIQYDRATAAITVDRTAGTVTGDASVGSDSFDQGVFEILGTAFGDSFTGSDDTPALMGFESYIGGDGTDTIDGGGGVDRIVFLSEQAGVNVDLAAGTAIDPFGNTDVISGIEAVSSAGADDTLLGNGDDNTFQPGGGSDQIDGRGGSDTVSYEGQPGTVTANLTTGLASDAAGGTDTLTAIENLTGSNFFDFLTGDSGANTLSGLEGADRLFGGDGADRLFGGAGGDTIEGGDGNDTLAGGAGDDSVIGGAGDNRYIYESGEDTLNNFDAGEGIGDRLDLSAFSSVASLADVVAISRDSGSNMVIEFAQNVNAVILRDVNIADLAEDDFIFAGQGQNHLGDAGDNTLTGGTGDDTLDGGDGNDRLTGAEGDDSLIGGAGADIAVLAGNLGGFTITVNGDRSLVLSDTLGADGADTLTGIEALAFADASVAVRLTEVTSDTIFGGAGADILLGQDGADDLRGQGGDDHVDGGDGLNLLLGNTGNDTLSGGIERDSIYGGDGQDSVAGGDGDDFLRGDGGRDTLLGGGGNDRLDSGAEADLLFGGTGNDVLIGRTGADTLSGGDDGDLMFGGDGADTMTGGLGGDRVDGGGDNDTLSGGGGDDTLIGKAGDDSIAGDDGADRIYGGSGADLIDGGDDTDLLFGDGGNDTLTGGAGNDLMDGRADDDSLLGGAGNDRLIGDAGSDVLDGGDGQDRLAGGEGNDSLTGGAGADEFRFKAVDGAASADIVTDFEVGLDSFRLFGGLTVQTVADADVDGDILIDDTQVTFSNGATVGLIGVTGLQESDLF